MNFETIRDAIFEKVSGVSGIGKVYRHRRYSVDLAGLLELFTVPHPQQTDKRYPCVAWIDRTSAPETGVGDELGTTVYVERTDFWRIELFHSMYDDENEEQASITAFQRLADRIQDAFRFDDDLGIPEVLESSGPLSMDVSDQYTQELNGFTCHYARFTLRTQQHLTS